MFKFADATTEQLYWDLFNSYTGEENCWDQKSVTPSKGRFVGETLADQYVENWTGRAITREVAEELCAGCPVYDKCKAYAMVAKEPIGIWGGTRPVDRK